MDASYLKDSSRLVRTELAGRGHEGDESSRLSIGPLFRGKAGLTIERWQFRKQWFEEVSKLLDAQVLKKNAIKAQMSMKKIEFRAMNTQINIGFTTRSTCQ